MRRAKGNTAVTQLAYARAGIIINTGEDNYLTTADAVEAAHTVTVSQLLNEFFAHEAGLPDAQLGLGHAVLMAKDLIGHEPFAVILPDDVVIGDRPCIGQLIHAYHQTHGSVVAVMEVPPSETKRYGMIAAEPTDDPLDHGRLHKVTRLVEKPAPEDAPPNLAIIGRYVLTPKIFDKLEQTPRGSGGEIQLTDAIAELMEEQAVYGYEFEGVRYDAGTTMGWLKASVELALQRPELEAEFRSYLKELAL